MCVCVGLIKWFAEKHNIFFVARIRQEDLNGHKYEATASAS